MTDDAYGATIAKRRLSRRLAELRLTSGYTANHVCDILNWGRGKVGRFEANQWKRPEMSDIRDLLRIYNADTTVQDELEDLAIRARARPWWREYPEIFGNEFPGFENDASHIRVFMPLILPGLLQTAAYVEAGLRTGPRSPAWRQKALETRLRRQEILARNGPTAPKVVAVITEASLMFRWGTRADQYEQIAHLAGISGRANVELRIQRFADGPYPGMLSMINIFGFPDAEPSLVFMETDYAVEEVSSADSVNAYEEAFSRARDGALEPTDTAAFLRQLAEQLE
jgi:transcriptional regulator with XRE-family HTH domain